MKLYPISHPVQKSTQNGSKKSRYKTWNYYGKTLKYISYFLNRTPIAQEIRWDFIKFKFLARHWWLTLVILATQKAEIRRIDVWGQPRQIYMYMYTYMHIFETLSWKNSSQKRGAGRLTQSIGPEFKPQYYTQKCFCTLKEIIARFKRQFSEWEHFCQLFIRLISKIYKKLKKLNTKSTKNPINKWAN
jgi:hypothetical protein